KLCLFELPAFEDGNTQELHGEKMVGQFPEQAPTKRLRVGVSFIAIGGKRRLQPFRRCPEFLLRGCSLEVAGADDASQALSPGDHRRDWCRCGSLAVAAAHRRGSM